MKLGVGAVSRIVVEEALKLQVPQIVASRRQVNIDGGYTGITQEELVKLSKELSGGKTSIVRDHGGPYQNGAEIGRDDWLAEFDDDVAAGFDSLHLDVSKLPRDKQVDELQYLIDEYGGKVKFEVGGERDDQEWLDTILAAALEVGTPDYAVMDTGGHIHADRQSGMFKPVWWVEDATDRYHEMGVKTKAHNMDWYGMRRRYDFALDAYNVAPEYSGAEADAWFSVMNWADVEWILNLAYASEKWARWFNGGEGTDFERARCALRYLYLDPEIQRVYDKYMGGDEELYVRKAVRDSIANS